MNSGPHLETTDSGESMTPATERRIRYLAALDWKGMPAHMVRLALGRIDDPKADAVSTTTVCGYRSTDLYKVALEEQRQEWREQMLKLPQTPELRKKIQHAMALSIGVVIDILVAGDDKDKLAAARLASQWDGRFMRSDNDDAEKPANESVAQEILTALKRHQETIQ
jgi:hypothetical protein